MSAGTFLSRLDPCCKRGRKRAGWDPLRPEVGEDPHSGLLVLGEELLGLLLELLKLRVELRLVLLVGIP